MGLFLGSVAFRRPTGDNQETLVAWVEQLCRQYHLELKLEDHF